MLVHHPFETSKGLIGPRFCATESGILIYTYSDNGLTKVVIKSSCLKLKSAEAMR